MTSLMRGYVCWKDGKPAEQVMRSFREGPPPAKHTLTDHGPYEDGDGWVEQTILKFKLLRDGGTELTFKASGITKLNAIGRLVKDFGAQYKTNVGLVPIVAVSSEEFESKAKGARGAKKFAPRFRITGWETEDNLRAIVEGTQADYEGGEEAPADEAPEELVAPPARQPAARPAAAPARQAAPAARQAAPARGAAPSGQRGKF